MKRPFGDQFKGETTVGELWYNHLSLVSHLVYILKGISSVNQNLSANSFMGW